MKKTITSAALVFTTALALGGCGGLSEEDASMGWGASFAEAITLQAAADQGARGAGETKNVPCSGGGSGDVVMNAGESTTVWNLDVKFNDCKGAMGVTISGPLAWKYEVDGTTFNYDFTGDLSWSGEVEGDCEIDLHMGGTAGAYTYSGHLCDYDTGDVY